MGSSASLVRPSGGSAPSADAREPHLGREPAAVSWEPEPAWKRDIPFSHGSAGKWLHWDTGCSSPSVHEGLIFHRILLLALSTVVPFVFGCLNPWTLSLFSSDSVFCWSVACPVAWGVSTPLVQQQVILSWPDKGCHRSHQRGLVAQVVSPVLSWEKGAQISRVVCCLKGRMRRAREGISLHC